MVKTAKRTRGEWVKIMLAATIVSSASWPGLPAQSTVQDDPAGVPRTSLIEFTGLWTAGAVLAVDVRSATSFAAGHIPGSMNVPLPEVGARARETLDRAAGRRIVTYCACASEQTSALAVLELRRRGVPDATALAGGYNEWVARGGRVEKLPPLMVNAQPGRRPLRP